MSVVNQKKMIYRVYTNVFH